LTTALLATSIFQAEIDVAKRAVVKRADIGSFNVYPQKNYIKIGTLNKIHYIDGISQTEPVKN